MSLMYHRSFREMNCSLAQALEVVGERWTLLILRDAFFGRRRFEQFQKSLGISRNILTARLKHLVREGILVREPIGSTKRCEYLLTDKGNALLPVLMALTHWGDTFAANPQGARLIFVDRATGRPVAPMAVRSAEGQPLRADEIRAVLGPGLGGAGNIRIKA